MQNGFQLTPDGMVYVRNGGQIYADTAANFYADYGQPAPALPEGAREMIYEQGKRHLYAAADGVVGGGDMPWTWGDIVVTKTADLLSAKAARDTPPAPTAEELKAQDNAAAQAKIAEIEKLQARAVRDYILGMATTAGETQTQADARAELQKIEDDAAIEQAKIR